MGRKLAIEEMRRLLPEEYAQAPKIGLMVLLDQVRSMNNVGSVLRSADAFRAERVYLGGITPKPPHREITKTAIGAEQTVAWEDCPDPLALVQSLQQQGVQILALEQAEGSVPLHAFPVDPGQRYLLIVGHEIDGVRQELVDLADATLEIPQFGTKHSLNVAVSAGIAMHHLAMPMWAAGG